MATGDAILFEVEGSLPDEDATHVLVCADVKGRSAAFALSGVALARVFDPAFER